MNNLPTVSQRKEALKKLLKNIIIHEEEILEALYKDFKKPKFEGIVTETSYIILELKNTINKIDSWSKPKWVFGCSFCYNFSNSHTSCKENIIPTFF